MLSVLRRKNLPVALAVPTSTARLQFSVFSRTPSQHQTIQIAKASWMRKMEKIDV